MYKIVTDGSCDLSVKRVKELEIKVVPFYVSIDGVNHQKEIVDLNIRDFYQFMIDNPKVFPKTSMPSIQDYLDVFTPLLKAGNDIICICITTKFSGSFNSAINAKNILLDDYPNAKIEIIDATVPQMKKLIETIFNGFMSGQYVLEIKANGSWNRYTPKLTSARVLVNLFDLLGMRKKITTRHSQTAINCTNVPPLPMYMKPMAMSIRTKPTTSKGFVIYLRIVAS